MTGYEATEWGPGMVCRSDGRRKASGDKLRKESFPITKYP